MNGLKYWKELRIALNRHNINCRQFFLQKYKYKFKMQLAGSHPCDYTGERPPINASKMQMRVEWG
jgi:hypothetical protein